MKQTCCHALMNQCLLLMSRSQVSEPIQLLSCREVMDVVTEVQASRDNEGTNSQADLGVKFSLVDECKPNSVCI